MTEKLVLDITNPQEQLAIYGKQRVGFYDGFKNGEPRLYIYIESGEDRYSVVRRRSGERKVPDSYGDKVAVDEKTLFKRAYDKYVAFKAVNGVEQEPAVKKVKEAPAEKPTIEEATIEIKDSEEKRSAAELKAELDKLGIEYKGNASKASLIELLNKFKEE